MYVGTNRLLSQKTAGSAGAPPDLSVYLLRNGLNSGPGAAGYFNDAAGIKSFDWHSKRLEHTGLQKLNWQTGKAFDQSGIESLDWEQRRIYYENGIAVFSASSGAEEGYLMTPDEEISVDFMFRRLYASGVALPVIDWQQRIQYGNEGNASHNWRFRYLHDLSGTIAVEYGNRVLKNSTGQIMATWASSQGPALLRNGLNSVSTSSNAMFDFAQLESVDWNSRFLKNASGEVNIGWGDANGPVLNRNGITALNVPTGIFNDFGGFESINYNARKLKSYLPSSAYTLDWENCILGADVSSPSLDWANSRLLYAGFAGYHAIDWAIGNIYYDPAHGLNQKAIEYSPTSGSRSVRITRSPLSFFGPGTLAADFGDSKLFDNNGTSVCIDWRSRSLFSALNVQSVLWGSRKLFGADGIETLDWSDAHPNFTRSATTPPTAIPDTPPLPTNLYGGNTHLLGNPDNWLRVKVNGTLYKIPCYL